MTGYQVLMGEFRTGDFYDAWGTTMGFFFATADVLYHETAEEIPSRWQFRHGQGCQGVDNDSYPDAMILDYLNAGDIEADDLIRFGNVLDRYAGILDAAGKSY